MKIDKILKSIIKGGNKVNNEKRREGRLYNLDNIYNEKSGMAIRNEDREKIKPRVEKKIIKKGKKRGIKHREEGRSLYLRLKIIKKRNKKEVKKGISIERTLLKSIYIDKINFGYNKERVKSLNERYKIKTK